MAKKIFFDIIFNSKKAEESLNKINNSFQEISKKAIVLGSKLGIAFSGFQLVKNAVRNYLEYDHTLARLSNNLVRLGVYHRDVVQNMINEQSELQQTLKVNDETIREIYNQLATFGIPIKYLKELSEGIIRFSKVVGMDFQSSAFIVAKSITGSINFLSRYGVEFKKTGDVIKDTLNLIDTLQIRFGSQTTDIFQSYTEELKHYQLAYEDFIENVGKYIVKGSDELFKSLIPNYRKRLELNTIIEEAITNTQVNLYEKRLKALQEYSKLEKQALVKRLEELKPVLKDYENKFIMARARLWEAIEGGKEFKLQRMASEKYLNEIMSKYSEVKGEVEAINQLLDEKLSKEQQAIEFEKKEEERFKNLLNNLTTRIRYLELIGKLNQQELKQSIDILNIELKKAEANRNYSRAVELIEKINELQKQYEYYTRASFENIRRLNLEYGKLANKVRIPSELKGVEEISVEYNLDRYFNRLDFERAWLQVYFTDVFDSITNGFEGSSAMAMEFIQGMRHAFSAVFNEIGDSFVRMWERSFGKANSLFEIFIQEFAGTMVQIGAMYLASYILKAITGVSLAALIFHKGGIVGKAHSGLLARDEVPVIAKKGEMILNDRQQAILWNMLNNGRSERQLNQTIVVNIDGEIITEKVIKSKLPKLINRLSYAI